MNSNSIPSIGEFFANKTVLITGGTGLVGKCLVEKLLRDCSRIKKIYLLLRPKNSESCQKRFKAYMASERVRNESRNWYEKLAFIPGDITVSGCGLKIGHIAMIESVQVLIHSAASLSLHAPLSQTIKDNLEGTLNVLNLANNCRQLQAFVYVSTAFCMPGNSLVKEKVYAPNIDPRKAIEIFSMLPAQWTDELTSTVVGNRCTYQYSKHLAENLVESYQHRLPVCIVRPGVILASSQEPFPGWNNVNADFSLFFKNIISGEIHTVPMKSTDYAPFTPVDTTVNTILGAAWRKAATGDTELRVYNCVTETNKVLLKTMISWAAEYSRNNISNAVVWYPHVRFTQYFPIFVLNQFLFRYVPAVFLDFLSTQRKKSSNRAFRSKRASLIAMFYGEITWSISNNRYTIENMQSLDQLMLLKDRLTFPTCLNKLDWNQFMRNFSAKLLNLSTRTNENNQNRASVHKTKRLKVIHWTMETLLFVFQGAFVVVFVVILQYLVNLVINCGTNGANH